MAQDRSYEMGCNCSKNLFWCDGSCEKFSHEPEQKPEKNFFKDTVLPVIWVVLAVAALVYVFMYLLPFPEKLRPVLF